VNVKAPAALFGAIAAALGLLAPASQPDPIEAARHNNLGCAYMNQQLFEKGLKEFQLALESDPKFTIARLNEGVAYMNLQKVDEAKAALEDALKQDPKNPNAWYGLGLLSKNTGDAQASIDAFKRVTEIDPNDADTWYFLGTAYAQAKQFPAAIEAFEHALKINPLHASAEFGLSRAYQQSGDSERAHEHLKKFQYITQNKIGAPMSLAYGEQGLYSRAVESPQAQLKPPPQINVRFVDATKEAGLIEIGGEKSSAKLEESFGPGACFLDYDNDGRIDLLLADNGPGGGVALLHNLGRTFEDVTRKAGLNPNLHAVGCAAADYDNDGFADIVLTTTEHISLLHNEKNGTFKDVSQSAGIRDANFTLGATFIDYDHDGDLDLYITRSAMAPGQVCGPGSYSGPGEPRASGKGGCVKSLVGQNPDIRTSNSMWRNDGNGSFTDVTDSTGLANNVGHGGIAAVGTDYNNDRAIDLIAASWVAPDGRDDPIVFENPREGKFLVRRPWPEQMRNVGASMGMALIDFDHDGWMDLALTSASISLWRNDHGKVFQEVQILHPPMSSPSPPVNWTHAYGVAAFDYDNDGWVDLVAVGETKDGKGEIRLFRNLGPDGFKDVTTDVGLDKVHLESPRAIITSDYDNDGATDLLITQNHSPAVLLRNEGATQNHWLKLSLKGLNDNKSAIGTKVEVFSGGNRQKFEIYGSNGYLGQNSTDIIVGLGQSKEADIVRMLWPSGVLQDEIQIAGDKKQEFLEIDRRGSSCPTLFAWDGERYEFVADMLGAGVVGHWIGPQQRDIPRPVEYVKIPTDLVKPKSAPALEPQTSDPNRTYSADALRPPPAAEVRGPKSVLSFRFMEPLEEAVYLDQVRLLAIDHPADLDVYPNEYFASNPPYPEFKVVVSRGAKPPSGAWDEHGHNVLPELLAHHFFGDFELTQFAGFAKPHTLTLDLGEPYDGSPLWLLMHGEIEYFTANSMYAAAQSKLEPIAPYVEAQTADGSWKRAVDDMGFPAGGPRTMTADLTGKLPKGTQKIRITTNLQIYWDNILINRTPQPIDGRHRERGHISGPAKDLPNRRPEFKVTTVPLVKAELEFHGYPYKIEGLPPGNVHYIYEKTSATGPYTRPQGTYTRYGDVLPLLTATDDKLAVFGSGDEVRLDFDPSHLPTLPPGWIRDYFFAANGYEKDMDFYAAEGNYVAPLPFLSMGEYPYPPKKSFPLDDAHVNYLLEYNTRHMSGKEQRGYWFDYAENRQR
jgi:tetratricopeptide (TPR) repeat protein